MEDGVLLTGMVYFAVVTLLVGVLAVMFGVWNRTAPKTALAATDAKVVEIEGRLDKVEDRVIELEGQVRHMPTKDDVHNLDRGLIHLTGIVEQQGERTSALLRSVDRIENYLMHPPAPPATPATSDRKSA